MYEFINPAKAAEYYKVSENTLRTWSNDGQLKFIKTSGGHRRYAVPIINTDKRNIIYARVSSRKQQSDLDHQSKYLQDLYPNHELVTDIGSGINYKRPGFISILESVFKHNISEVIVASKDRFSRLGTNDLFEWIFQEFGARLIFLSNIDETNANEELTSDLMEVITVFTARYHGRKRYNISKDTNISESSTV